jgi:Zn-dependent M28 family amino/carboxypeptidase
MDNPKTTQDILFVRNIRIVIFVFIFSLFLVACQAQTKTFDGQEALKHAAAQMELGPRPTGSQAWQATGDYISSQLKRFGWSVEEQTFEYRDTPVRNIIGRKGSGPVIILGAHYDTRRRANQDSVASADPVPGANDGASGVAVLLELARSLNEGKLNNEIWLAFFDAEDNGDLDGWEWIVGSTYMAENMTITPEVVIVVDMIGDADQQIYYERNSNIEWTEKIWETAAGLGFEQNFIPKPKWSMLDDHTPFIRQGYKAVDLIDFDYPYWHTTADTLDKISADSLMRVGLTLQVLLEGD